MKLAIHAHALSAGRFVGCNSDVVRVLYGLGFMKKIDMNDFPSGFYFIQLVNTKIIKNFKIVIIAD